MPRQRWRDVIAPKRHLYLAHDPFWHVGDDVWFAWAFGLGDDCGSAPALWDDDPPTVLPRDEGDLCNVPRANGNDGRAAPAAPRAAHPCPAPGCARVLAGPAACDEHYAAHHGHPCPMCAVCLPSEHLLTLHLGEVHGEYLMLAPPLAPTPARPQQSSISAAEDGDGDRVVGGGKTHPARRGVPWLACVTEGCAATFRSREERAEHLRRRHSFPRRFAGWRALRVGAAPPDRNPAGTRPLAAAKHDPSCSSADGSRNSGDQSSVRPHSTSARHHARADAQCLHSRPDREAGETGEVSAMTCTSHPVRPDKGTIDTAAAAAAAAAAGAVGIPAGLPLPPQPRPGQPGFFVPRSVSLRRKESKSQPMDTTASMSKF
jgi:hypothetical protein